MSIQIADILPSVNLGILSPLISVGPERSLPIFPEASYSRPGTQLGIAIFYFVVQISP